MFKWMWPLAALVTLSSCVAPGGDKPPYPPIDRPPPATADRREPATVVATTDHSPGQLPPKLVGPGLKLFGVYSASLQHHFACSWGMGVG